MPLGSQPATYNATQGVERKGHLWNIATLEKIGSLENLFLGHAVLLDCRLEALNVLHQLEVGAALLNLLHGARGQLIDQLAQPDAVLEDVLILAAGHLLAEHGEDPVEHLLFLFLVAWLQ